MGLRAAVHDASLGDGMAEGLLEGAILLGFLRENVPLFEQYREKPEKTCGNRRNGIDKARGKAEGELRYSFSHPHEHW
jgi:hypothetical protein